MEDTKSAFSHKGSCLHRADDNCEKSYAIPSWQGSGAYNVVNGYGKANVRHVPQFVGLMDKDDDDKKLTHMENKLPSRSTTTSSAAPLEEDEE